MLPGLRYFVGQKIKAYGKPAIYLGFEETSETHYYALVGNRLGYKDSIDGFHTGDTNITPCLEAPND